MSKTTERQRLLQRWAEMEPDKCTVFGIWWKLDTDRLLPLDLTAWARSDDWTLLGALIESITARGWRGQISFAPKGTRGEVECIPRYDLKFDAIAGNVADALLSAYILAIEAEKK